MSAFSAAAGRSSDKAFSGAASKKIVSIANVTVCSYGDSGCEPYFMQFDPANNYTYVADDDNFYGWGTVSVISGTSEIFQIQINAPFPQFLTYDSADKDIFVPVSSDKTVYVISGKTNTISKTIKTPSGAFYPLYDPANGEMYVTDSIASGNKISSTGLVSVINSKNFKIIKNIELPCYGTSECEATFMVYDPANQYVYVSVPVSSSGAFLYAINSANTVVESISLNGGSNCGVGLEEDGYLVYNLANMDVYTVCFASGTVDVVSSANNRLVATPSAGYEPSFLAYDPANQAVYVNSENMSGDGAIYVIDNTLGVQEVLLKTLLGICCLSGSGTFLVYSPTDQDMYGVDASYGLITVVSSTSAPKVVATLQGPVGEGDQGFDMYNPANGYVYVTGAQPVISVWS